MDKKMPVVGIAGVIGAGKDTIALYLERRFEFQIIRFSDALKEEVLTRLPRTCTAIWQLHYGMMLKPQAVDLHEMVYQDKPHAIRELLQEYGTEVRRADTADYWSQEWKRRVLLRPALRPVVAPDMRFFNEACAVKHFVDSRTVLVTRKGQKKGDHASENGLNNYPFDVRFTNDGDIPALEAQVEKWVLDEFGL